REVRRGRLGRVQAGEQLAAPRHAVDDVAHRLQAERPGPVGAVLRRPVLVPGEPGTRLGLVPVARRTDSAPGCARAPRGDAALLAPDRPRPARAFLDPVGHLLADPGHDPDHHDDAAVAPG